MEVREGRWVGGGEQGMGVEGIVDKNGKGQEGRGMGEVGGTRGRG